MAASGAAIGRDVGRLRRWVVMAENPAVLHPGPFHWPALRCAAAAAALLLSACLTMMPQLPTFERRYYGTTTASSDQGLIGLYHQGS